MTTAETTKTADPGPFGIDTPDYSDRDREMFVLGYEFAEVSRDMRRIGSAAGASSLIGAIHRTIHEANVDRLVALAESLDLRTRIHHCGDGWCRFRTGVAP